jgi:hypothetical protein
MRGADVMPSMEPWSSRLLSRTEEIMGNLRRIDRIVDRLLPPRPQDVEKQADTSSFFPELDQRLVRITEWSRELAVSLEMLLPSEPQEAIARRA